MAMGAEQWASVARLLQTAAAALSAIPSNATEIPAGQAGGKLACTRGAGSFEPAEGGGPGGLERGLS